MGLAARGARELNGRKVLLETEEQAEYFRARTKRIYAKTFFATLFLMIAGRAWLYYVRS